MARELTPEYAANLANDIYQGVTEPGFKAFAELYATDMLIGKSSMAAGATGLLLKKPHVMALFAAGQGDYKGQAFAAFKGTASLFDALTDINVGLCSSCSGPKVHQGFQQAFDSVKQELARFVTGVKGITTVHCVGHSLGGAVATLAADYMLFAGGVAQVNLYTFGSPRVGYPMFASTCTQRVQAKNVYRVSHKTDPVPMVPTWPFQHVPTSEADYLINSPVSPTPWKYHLMEHYIDSVADKTWPKILSHRPKAHTEAAIEAWLRSDGLVSLSARTLDLMNAALMYVVGKAIHGTGIVLITTASAGFTLLDRMAEFLAKTAKLSVQVGLWVHHLIKKMASLIGLVVKEGADLTAAFVRMVFLRVHHHIAQMIQRISRRLN